jgi:DNA-binding MarR family transcriptional regulator
MIDMEDAPSADQPLGYLLRQVTTALRTDVTENVLEPLGLTFPQFICLRMLMNQAGPSNADLARKGNVSPQAMNMVLRGLEQRGLVTRPKRVASGRSLPAQLTREGRELLERMESGVRATEDRLLANLTVGRRREFKQILAELASSD